MSLLAVLNRLILQQQADLFLCPSGLHSGVEADTSLPQGLIVKGDDQEQEEGGLEGEAATQQAEADAHCCQGN